VEGSKLIGLLRNCDSIELKRFEKYMSSPYFNTNEANLKIITILRKAAPEFKAKKINREKIFASIYPNKAYSDKSMSNLMSEVVKHLENFWAFEKFNKNKISRKISLAKNYYEHNIEHIGEQLLDDAVKDLQKIKPHATELYERQLDINTIKHEIIEAKEQRNVEPNLQAIHDQLDSYFIVSKLKYYYKCLNFTGLTDHKYDINMKKSVMDQAESEKYAEHDAIQIYYHAVKTLLSFENDENFIELKRLLIKNSSNYAPDEVQDMIRTARNFAIRRLNRGESTYAVEALDLYKLELSEGLLYDQDSISDVPTRNIVLLAKMAKETEWALSFLTKYKRFISKETFTFCKASVKFGRSEYEEVLDLLGKTSFSDPLLNLSVRALNLQTHFEKFIQNKENYKYEDNLEDYIASFNKHLKVHTGELTARVLFYQNLLDYVSELFEMLKKDKINKSALKKMKDSVNEKKQVAQKLWLIEKIESQL